MLPQRPILLALARPAPPENASAANVATLTDPTPDPADTTATTVVSSGVAGWPALLVVPASRSGPNPGPILVGSFEGVPAVLPALASFVWASHGSSEAGQGTGLGSGTESQQQVPLCSTTSAKAAIHNLIASVMADSNAAGGMTGSSYAGPSLPPSGTHDLSPEALRQAVGLPPLHDFRIHGSFDPQTMEHTFQIPIDGATQWITIDVRPTDGASGPVVEHMQVFDGQGHSILVMGPPPGSDLLEVRLPTGGIGGFGSRFDSLYVKLSLPAGVFGPDGATPGGSGTAPGIIGTAGGAHLGTTLVAEPGAPTNASEFGFVLEVTRQEAAAPASGAPSTGVLTPVVTVATLPRAISGVSTDSTDPPFATAPGETDEPGEASSDEDQPPKPVPVPVATGPLPGRSSAPLGGLLSGDEPGPMADPRDPALIDLALLDLPAEARDRFEGDHPASDDDYGEPSASTGYDDFGGKGHDAVVTLRGPGGIPLRGPSLLTESTTTGTSRFPDLPLLTDAGDATVLPKVDMSNVPVVAGDGTVRRTSFTAGISVALALTLGFVLPDLVGPVRDEEDRKSWLRQFLKRRGRSR